MDDLTNLQVDGDQTKNWKIIIVIEILTHEITNKKYHNSTDSESS